MAVQDMAFAPSFRVGEVIGKSLSIWFKNLLPFGVLGIVFNIPLAIVGYTLFKDLVPVQIQVSSGEPAQLPPGFGWDIFVAWLVMVVCYQLLTAAVTYGAIQRLGGHSVSIVACFGQALSRFLPVILTGFVASLLIWLACFLLVIPGIIVALNFCVVIPVCVIEGSGVSASLSRSKDLARGYRWKIFGILLIAAVVAIVIQQALGLFIRLAASAQTSVTSVMYLGVGSFVINQAIFTTLVATIAACVYYYLRVAKEGVDIDQIAAVFD